MHRRYHLDRAYMNICAYFNNVRPEGLSNLLFSQIGRRTEGLERYNNWLPETAYICLHSNFLHTWRYTRTYRKIWVYEKTMDKLDEQKLSLHCIFSSDDLCSSNFIHCLLKYSYFSICAGIASCMHEVSVQKEICGFWQPILLLLERLRTKTDFSKKKYLRPSGRTL